MRQIVTVYRQRHPDKPELVGAIAQALKEDKSLTEEQRKELASGTVNAPAQYDVELLRRAMKVGGWKLEGKIKFAAEKCGTLASKRAINL